MYRILGADGREYSATSDEQLRAWIAQRRADGNTRVLPPNGTEWVTLATLPEFVDALAAATATPGTPAKPPPLQDPEKLAAAIIQRDYRVLVGSCLGRGWDLVMANFWLLVGAEAIAFVIMGAAGAIPYAGVAAGLVVNGALMGGVYLVFLRRIRGERASIEDVFAGFTLAFAQLLLGHLVTSLLSVLGLLLCLIPGIYVAVAWLFAIPLIIDRRLDFWPAMELSRKVVARHWWTIFWLTICCGVVTLAGLLLACVGVFITAPVATAALMYAYEDIFGQKSG